MKPKTKWVPDMTNENWEMKNSETVLPLLFPFPWILFRIWILGKPMEFCYTCILLATYIKNQRQLE